MTFRVRLRRRRRVGGWIRFAHLRVLRAGRFDDDASHLPPRLRRLGARCGRLGREAPLRRDALAGRRAERLGQNLDGLVRFGQLASQRLGARQRASQLLLARPLVLVKCPRLVPEHLGERRRLGRRLRARLLRLQREAPPPERHRRARRRSSSLLVSDRLREFAFERRHRRLARLFFFALGLVAEKRKRLARRRRLGLRRGFALSAGAVAGNRSDERGRIGLVRLVRLRRRTRTHPKLRKRKRRRFRFPRRGGARRLRRGCVETAILRRVRPARVVDRASSRIHVLRISAIVVAPTTQQRLEVRRRFVLPRRERVRERVGRFRVGKIPRRDDGSVIRQRVGAAQRRPQLRQRRVRRAHQVSKREPRVQRGRAS